MSIDIRKLDKQGILSYFNISGFGISAFTLKLIAIVTMLIDHIAVVHITWLPLYLIMRAVGRVSFPIFAFLIVEGFFHTSDRKKYALRLGMFAIISEIPYDLAFHKQFVYMEQQNIFFTLLIGLVAIWGLNSAEKGSVRLPKKLVEKYGYASMQSLARCTIMIIACAASELTKCSYTYAGLLLILCFYAFYEKHVWKIITNAFFNIVLYGGTQSFGTFSVIPIALYNGRQGSKKWKWFFYWFYPMHLLILALLAYIRW